MDTKILQNCPFVIYWKKKKEKKEQYLGLELHVTAYNDWI